ncbi:EF-hand domain-containing protein [bacterium]|nr:EF-hand domain-containing protein [bacterium]
MSVSNTTQKTGFFKSIGNWFNKNGSTVGKSMQLAGQTAMGVSVMGMMFNEMNKSHCHCHGASIWGGGFGGCMSTWGMGGMMSPYNMGGCGMFGGMSMLNNMSGMTNPYLTMSGIQSAQNFGFMRAMASRQNMFTNPMQTNPMYQNFYNNSYNQYSNQYTSDLNSGTDYDSDVDYTSNNKSEAKLDAEELDNTDKGEEMDTAFNNRKTFTYIDDKDATAEDKQNARIEYAKSYVAYVDQKEGDKNGFISEDEFVEHEINETGTDEASVRKAFRQFDLNNDEKLDYKEYAAILRAYDEDNDGKITATEVRNANTASASGITRAQQTDDESKDRFRRKLNTNYEQLS